MFLLGFSFIFHCYCVCIPWYMCRSEKNFVESLPPASWFLELELSLPTRLARQVLLPAELSCQFFLYFNINYTTALIMSFFQNCYKHSHVKCFDIKA